MMAKSFHHFFVLLLLYLCISSAYGANIVSDSWVQVATPVNPPTPRHSHSAVMNTVNKSMIIFGGVDATTCYNDISIYTIDIDEWATEVPPTDGVAPLSRYGHTAVATAAFTMVVFGGRNGTVYYNDVAIYDMVANSWLPVAVSGTAPSPRAYHTAVVDDYRHVMYVYGGNRENEYYDDVYAFNLESYTWSYVTPANGTAMQRAYHTAILSSLGVMVVFGGLGPGGVGWSDVHCYGIKTKTWVDCLTDKSPAPEVRYGHSAVISPLQVMTVFGGQNSGGSPVNDVWNFDLVLYRWSVVVPGGLAIDVSAKHSAIATPFGSMIVFGGLNSDNIISNTFGLYNLASTVLRSANDGAVMVVLITLLGTILIAMCFAIDYMQEQSEIEKEEAIERAKQEQLNLLPKLPAIPKALRVPLGPRAQKFFNEFKTSLDPMQDPPQ